ncbi:unnamed protein product [Ilex paraguariensis]|uniref:Uncharacterized protein n=1 Tax=Ilex paraguariensis TaxID=185542 RepID=A0ABC8QP47_9AQUA
MGRLDLSFFLIAMVTTGARGGPEGNEVGRGFESSTWSAAQSNSTISDGPQVQCFFKTTL